MVENLDIATLNKKEYTMIKKLFIMLVGFFLIIQPTTVMACEETIDDERYAKPMLYVADEEEFWIDPEYEMELFINSKTLASARASTKLSILRLTQTDSRWANDPLNGCPGTTIKSSGCALVSMTMVYNFIKIKSVKPSYINDNYVVCSMNWEQIPKNLGFSRVAHGYANSSNALSTFKPYLNNGNPIIIQVNNSNNDAHFMVVYGYDSNGTIYINDPDSTDFKTLKDSEDSGWKLRYYHVFK